MIQQSVSTAYQTSAEDFTCAQCGVTRRVHLVSAGMDTSNMALRSIGAVRTSSAQRQADRALSEMRKLLVCPNCGHRNSRAYTWLFLKAATIGLVIGLIGAVPGLVLPLLYKWPFWAGPVAGILAVTIPATVIIYRRRIKDHRIGVRFE
jgi:transcription elongation factor Elf1